MALPFLSVPLTVPSIFLILIVAAVAWSISSSADAEIGNDAVINKSASRYIKIFRKRFLRVVGGVRFMGFMGLIPFLSGMP